MEKEILIIGTHPIRDSIIKQYEGAGCRVELHASFGDVCRGKEYHELCVVTDEAVGDKDVLESLALIAADYPATAEGVAKPVCHLLLHNNITLNLMRMVDLYPEIQHKFELYAFTIEDQWAKNILFTHALDREKIDEKSNKTVHLVIAGYSELSESLAIHTALTMHFPNYERNHTLRTRITIVDRNISTPKNAFTQRHAQLFDNSYYRSLDLSQRCVTQYHEPRYAGSREDFVDVEWEFVEADFFDSVLQQKIEMWAESDDQLLTIALCDSNADVNFDRAFTLPDAVYSNEVPVFVNLKQAGLLDEVRKNGKFKNLVPVGMYDCGYDISLPLLQMAKRLNYCYNCSYGKKEIPTDMPAAEVEKMWSGVGSFSIRYSNIYNVMTISTKMRILGHKEGDWDKYYALTKAEIEQIAAVEHNRWSVERLIMGFRPPTDTERDEIKHNIDDLKDRYKKQKVHYDLCSYRELKEDKTGQNVQVYDYDLVACIPLIAQSYKETKR
ncbi:MAG: hypothetical protein J5708_01235 [Bacteroidales bacterium]|nr:hypothetical protein [Bacteroidales bacterium]